MRTPPPPSLLGRRLPLVIAAACVLAPALLSATIEEQRARLPPPAVCSDPVEGIWRAHHFNLNYRDWSIVTITLRRSAAGAPTLQGAIAMEYWTGTEREQEPPPCRRGLRHYIVDQDAVGALGTGGQIRVDSLRYRVRTQVCPGSFHGYNLDHFSGVIDPARQEFQSVNNDGGRDVNEPIVFRRIRCFEPGVAPHPEVPPPPFFPKIQRRGCGRAG